MGASSPMMTTHQGRGLPVTLQDIPGFVQLFIEVTSLVIGDFMWERVLGFSLARRLLSVPFPKSDNPVFSQHQSADHIEHSLL